MLYTLYIILGSKGSKTPIPTETKSQPSLDSKSFSSSPQSSRSPSEIKKPKPKDDKTSRRWVRWILYCIRQNVRGVKLSWFSLNHESFPTNYGLVNWQYKSTSMLPQKFYSKHSFSTLNAKIFASNVLLYFWRIWHQNPWSKIL